MSYRNIRNVWVLSFWKLCRSDCICCMHVFVVAWWTNNQNAIICLSVGPLLFSGWLYKIDIYHDIHGDLQYSIILHTTLLYVKARQIWLIGWIWNFTGLTIYLNISRPTPAILVLVESTLHWHVHTIVAVHLCSFCMSI